MWGAEGRRWDEGVREVIRGGVGGCDVEGEVG